LAIKLTLGVLQGTRADQGTLMAKLATLAPSASFPFDLLYSWAWDSVSDSTKSLLMVTSLFPGTIPQNALSAASGLGPHVFSGALEQALQFNLLERAMDGSYWMHTNTSAYVRAQRHPQLEREAWDRYARLYLERIRPMVVREQPERRYWNALVSDNMRPVEAEWKT
jgi:hypothetical protein